MPGPLTAKQRAEEYKYRDVKVPAEKIKQRLVPRLATDIDINAELTDNTVHEWPERKYCQVSEENPMA